MYEMECINFYIFNSCLKASFSTRPFNTHIPDILLSKTLILDTRSFVKRIFVRLNIILCHLLKFRTSDNLNGNGDKKFYGKTQMGEIMKK